MKIIATALVLFLCTTIYAQEYSIKGIVTNSKEEPISAVNISLLSAQDSSWLKTEITDEAGMFHIPHVIPNKYMLVVSALGYTTKKVPISVVGNVEHIKIDLDIKANQLNEVVVNEQTYYIKTELGKTIIDVGKAAKSGVNILELLGKLPGVTVRPDGAITIDGKEGVVLMVNNKPTYMNGEELVSYLRGLSATEIKQVEIMTQPSAKYDAEGNVGIINLEMNKYKLLGLSGSINSRYSQGLYPFQSLNGDVKYNKGKWRTYIQPGFYGGYSFLSKEVSRVAYDNDSQKPLVSINESTFMVEEFYDYNLKVGADYDLSEKTTLGAFIKGVYHPNNEKDKTSSTINSNSSNLVNKATNENGFIREHAYANMYIAHKFNDNNNLDFDADYFGTWKDVYQRLDSRNYNLSNQIVDQPFLLDNKMPVASHVYSAKIDYSGSINAKKIEAGAKTSYVTIDEANVFNSFDAGRWQYDSLRSNHFLYDESISAMYLNSSWGIGKWQMQIGTRGELSIINGHELLQNEQFSRKQFTVFPTAYVLYKADSNHSFECNYGRRIKRPFYRELNPFTRFVSQYNYASGNPQLLPQYTHNVQLKHNYKSKLITTLGYSRSTNVFTQVFYLDKQTNISNYSTTNHAKQTTADLSIYMHLPVIKEWLLTCTGSGYYTMFEGMIGDKVVDSSTLGYTIKVDSQFYFKRGWYASVSGQYTGPSITLIGTIDSMLYTNASISKKVFNDSGTVRIDINDPFQLYQLNTNNRIRYTTSKEHIVFNTQNVALSFSYNIGNKGKKNRTEEISEEIKRM